MLDIELFSELCWCGDSPRGWNRFTRRGILYRGKAHIVDASAPFITKTKTVTPVEGRAGRSDTWGT